jgi:hypothetical protein
MTTVQRSLYINTIEPQVLSMNVPANTPLTVNLSYYDQAGAKITNDLLAQLQLTPRTNGGPADTWPAPVTDLKNGQARVSIAAGELTDMNGYRLRLLGTWRGDQTLLAIGVLRLTESAGIDMTPVDVIDQIPINISAGYGCQINIHLWQDAAKETPFDLTSATVSAAIYTDAGETTQLTPFTVSVIGAGEVQLGLTDVQVNALPSLSWWSLRVANAAGVTTLAEGSCTVT